MAHVEDGKEFRVVEAKYGQPCYVCRTPTRVGENIYWQPATHVVAHKVCYLFKT